MEINTDTFLQNLDWNLLRTFAVIVEEASVTAAAHRLGVSQPAVTNALKRLEAHSARRLIERGQGVFELTSAGKRLYEAAHEVRGIVSRLPSDMSASDGELEGTVALTVGSHIHSRALERALQDFRNRHARVTFAVDLLESREIITQVQSRRLGLGICTAASTPEGLDALLISTERIGFYCGRGHRLYGQTDLSISDLKEEAFVVFDNEKLQEGLHHVAVFKEQQGLQGRIAAVSSSHEEIRRLIVAGIGIGSLSKDVVDAYVKPGLLWQLPPYEGLPVVYNYLVTHPAARLSLAEQAFRNRLAEEAAAGDTSKTD
jgi:DNA-binding transcriptional LysR family regulator